MKYRRKGKVASKSRNSAIIEYLEPRVLYSADAFLGLSPDPQSEFNDLSQSFSLPWEPLPAVLPAEKLLAPDIGIDFSAEQSSSVESGARPESQNPEVSTLLAVNPAATTISPATVGSSESDGRYESVLHIPPGVTSVPESAESERSVADSAEQPASKSNSELKTDPVGALVFVDVRTPDYQVLLEDLQRNSPDTVFDYVLLSSDEDGLEKITDTLSRYESVNAVHIVSHGSAGGVQLGSVILNDDLVTARGSELLHWSDHLTESADILFYGCNLASTAEGVALVNDVALLTGADIASSDDLTGNAERGGDWDFEVVVGQIETDVVFSEIVQANYKGVFSTYIVDTTEDVVNASDGVLSLREAIIAVNDGAGGDTIQLGAGVHELSIMESTGDAHGDLDIYKDVEIIGMADGTSVIDASGLTGEGVFDVLNGDATFKNLTITGGDTTGTGGGIAIGSSRTVIVDNVVVTGNKAATHGGGIYSTGTLTVTNSTISLNTASGIGGGIMVSNGVVQLDSVTVSNNNAVIDGGGVYLSNGTHDLTNVTVSGNTAGDEGGGVYIAQSGTGNLYNTTITDNTADNNGGGIINKGTANVTGSIIAGNHGLADADVSGTINSVAHNIIADETGLLLGTLADNGGAVQTHELLPGSVALDGSAAATPSETDARGYFVADATRDIGAFERGATPPAEISLWVSTLNDVTSGNGGPGLDGWTEQEVVQIGDPNLELESTAGTTNGTFSSIVNLDQFSGANGDIKAMHRVGITQTVDGVALQVGDILFASNSVTTYSSDNSVTTDSNNIYRFRPTTPGDYSSGTFSLYGPSANISGIKSFTLVETATTVGDRNLDVGDFLYATASDHDLRHYHAVTGTWDVILDGGLLGVANNNSFHAIELIEETTEIAGVTFNAGEILVSIESDDSLDGGVDVKQQDLIRLDVSNTGTGSTSGTAEVVFEGADLGFSSAQTWDALSVAAIEVSEENTAPTFTDLAGGSISYTEGATNVVALDIDVTIFDEQLSAVDDFGGAVLTFERVGGANADDNFNRVTGTNLAFVGSTFELSSVPKGSYTLIGGMLTLTFDAGTTNANVNEIMQSIGYRNLQDDNPPASVDIQWTFSDGNTGGQGSGGALDATGNATVNITAVNDLATTDLDANDDSGATGNDSVTNFNGTPVLIADSDAIVVDPDSTSFFRMDVKITNLQDGAAESLAVDVSGYSGFNASYSQTFGSLVISGTGTQADYEAILRAIEYDNSAAIPDTTARLISVELTDGGGFGVISYSTIEFEALTDLSSGIELNTDGGNDAYLFADNGDAILGGLDSITLEVMFSASDKANGFVTPLLSYKLDGTSTSSDLLLALTDDGRLSLTVRGATLTDPGSIGTTIYDGNVHSVAATWDSANGNVAFYLDGALQYSFSPLMQGQVIASGGEIVFGQEQGAALGGFESDEYLNATLYDVRIWDEVRSAADIALNYQNKFDPTPGNLPAGLVANWQMDGFDGSNQVVDVVSGNNLSISHAAGVGFTASTPVNDLHIVENAVADATVGFVVPTDLNEVTSSYIFTLTDPSSNFEINNSTGKITVAATNTLDYETTASHDVTVEVTNAAGGVYNEVMTITVDDIYEAPIAGGFEETWLADETPLSNTGTSSFHENSGHQNAQITIDGQSYYHGIGVHPTGSGAVTEYALNGATSFTAVAGLNDMLVSGGEVIFRAYVDSVEVFNSGTVDHDMLAIPVTIDTTGGSVLRLEVDTAGTEAADHAVWANALLIGTATQATTISLAETATSGTFAGTYDAGDTLTYSLADDAGGRFAINANTGAIVVADESQLDFEATNNSHSITVQINDGTTFTDHAVTIELSDVNELPSGSDNTITILEDTTHTFQTADFGFTDPDGDTIQAIHIASLSNGGTLTINGTPVSANQIINVADLPDLVYTPAADANGAGYDSFDFTVRDSRQQFAASTNRLTVDVSPVNDAPEFLGITATAATTPFINEIHYDNVGTDTGEAVEIAGPAGTDLTGWSLVMYNGATGTEYGTDVLSGGLADQGSGFGTLVVSYPSNGIQNGGPDGIALVNDLGIVVQFLSYEGVFTAVNGPAVGLTSIDIGVEQTAQSALVGTSMQLTDSGWAAGVTETFGAQNTGQDFAILDGHYASETIPEGSTLTFSSTNPTGNAITVGDADVNAAELVMTIQVGSGSVSLGSIVGLSNLTGDGTGTITFSATVADINDALEGMTYDGDENYNGVDQLTLSVDDQGNTGGGSLTDVANVSITVTPVNDVPVLDLDADNSAAPGFSFNTIFTENGGPVFIADADAIITDVDDANLTSLQVSIINFPDGVNELVTANSGSTGLSVNYSTATGVLTISGTGSVADYQQVLRTVTYENLSENPDSTQRLLNVVAFDSSLSNSLVAQSHIDIVAVNDAPTLANLDADVVNYTVGDTATLLDVGSDVLITDVDSSDFDGGELTISIVSGGDLSDYYGIQPQGSGPGQINVVGTGSDVTYGGVHIGTITGSASAGALEITLNANADQAAVQALTKVIVYGNTNSVNPETTTRTFEFILTDGDGAASTASVVVVQVGVNLPPSSDAGSFTGNEDATSIGISISGSDPDGSIGGYRIISLPSNGTLYNDASLTAPVTVTTLYTSLETVSLFYVPFAEFNGPDQFEFAIIDNRGVEDPTPAMTNLTIIPVNDAPTGTDNTIATSEDGVHAIAPGTFGFTDIDSHSFQSVIVTTLPTNGTLTLNGADVIAGQEIALLEFPGVLYTAAPDINGIPADSFTFLLRDDGGTANGGTNIDPIPNTIWINVYAANDAPVIDLDADDSTGTIGLDYNTLFRAGGDAVSLTDGAAVSDIDSTIQELTIRITNIADGSNEILSFTHSGNIASSYSTIGGVLQLFGTGSTTNSDFMAVINSLTYENISATPDTTTREITFVANDGSMDSIVATTFVSLVADVTAPIVINNISSAVDEGSIDLIESNELLYADDLQSTGLINYNVTSSVSNGFLVFATDLSTPITRFSQADIDTNNLFYINDGSEANSDSFTFTVDDSQGNFQTDQVFNIAVVAQNDAPVFTVPVNQVTDEDTPLVFSSIHGNQIFISDSDALNSPLEVTLTVTNGTISLGSTAGISLSDGIGINDTTATFQGTQAWVNSSLDGLTFSPAADFYGVASINIQTNDLGNSGAGGARLESGLVYVVVDPINDAPTSTPVALTPIQEDSGIRVITQSELLANASDIEGDALTATGLAITAGSGTLVDNGDGTWSYTPAADDDTDVSFGYAVTDGTNSVAGSGTHDITPVNDAPTTTPVALTAIVEDSGVRVITQTELLANASDIEGDSLTAAGLVITGGNGSLVDNGDETWNYTPAADDDTDVSFGYTVTDGTDNVAGIGTLDINPINDAPISTPVALTAIAEDSGVRVITQTELLANASDIEGDGLTATGLVITGGNGSLVDNGDETWNYTPAADDDTDVSFGYTVTDGTDNVAGIGTLDINPINDAPISTPVALTAIAEGSGVRVITQTELLANASDIEGDGLTATGLVITGGNGSLVDNGDGTWNYTPAADDDTDVSFGYTVTDGTDNVAGIGTLDINPVNDAPISTPVALTAIAEDSGVRVITQTELLANASDIEGDSLTAAGLVITGGNGSLVDNGDETWNYTPAADDDTDVSFGYTVTDGTDNVAGIGTLDISSVNDAPGSVDQTIILAENGIYEFGHNQFSFIDVDSNGYQSVYIMSLPTSGTLALNGIDVVAGQEIDANNTAHLIYTAGVNVAGSAVDSFTFAVRDDGGTQNGGADTDPTPNTVSVDILAVNDSPVILVPAAQTVLEDTSLKFSVVAGNQLTIVDVDANSSTIWLSIGVDTGSLTLSGTAGLTFISGDGHDDPAMVVEGSVEAVNAALEGASYLPPLNYVGSAKLSLLTDDLGNTGSGGSYTDARLVDIDITAVNDPPVGGNSTIQATEDTVYVIGSSDFPFTDALDGDEFSGVFITSLPDDGVISLSGAPVFVTDFIDAQQIKDGALVFTPPLNYVGNSNQTLEYLVRDSGGSSNGGVDTDPKIHQMAFNVAAVNDAPQIITKVVTLDEGSNKLIDSEYLSGSDIDDLLPQDLTYTLQSHPDNGDLSLSGVVLAAGDKFTLAELIANQLRYEHDGSENYSDFVDLSLADGGEDGVAAALARLSFVIHNVIDQAPLIEDDQLTLEFGKPFRSTDGDSLASGFVRLSGNLLQEHSGYVLSIDRAPEHGSLDVDLHGNFTYVHNDSEVLQDAFTYRITNEDGVYTLATVSIFIEPPIDAAIDGSTSVEFSSTDPKLDTEDAATLPDNIEKSEQQVEPNITEITPVDFGVPAAAARSDNLQNSLAIDMPVKYENIGYTKIQLDYKTLAVKQHNLTNNKEIESIDQSADESYLEFVLADKSYGVSNSSYFRGLMQLDSDFAEAESAMDSSKNIVLTNEEIFGITFSATAGLVAWVLRGGALLASVAAAAPMWASIDPIRMFNGKHQDDQSDDVEELFDGDNQG